MDYRKNDNKAVEDEHEGNYFFDLEFPRPTWVSTTWLRHITFGIHDYVDTNLVDCVIRGNEAKQINLTDFNIAGTGTLYSGDLEITQVKNGKALLSGSMRVALEPANALIFSMSNDHSHREKTFEEYDSQWFLPTRDSGAFSKRILGHLRKTVTADDFTHPMLDSFSSMRDEIPMKSASEPMTAAEANIDPRTIQVKAFHANVVYSSRVKVIRDEREMPIQDFRAQLSRALFTKHPDYLKEHEYRFLFYPQVDGLILKYWEFRDKFRLVPFRLVEDLLLYMR